MKRKKNTCNVPPRVFIIGTIFFALFQISNWSFHMSDKTRFSTMVARLGTTICGRSGLKPKCANTFCNKKTIMCQKGKQLERNLFSPSTTGAFLILETEIK